MWSLRPISYSALSGWKDDDHGAALAAFQRQALKPIDERYKTGSIGITPAAFDPLIALSQKPEAIKTLGISSKIIFRRLNLSAMMKSAAK